MTPPRLATWLLGWLEGTSSPLVGDLYEEWHHGRAAGWFWRQTMRALYARAASYGRGAYRSLAFLGLTARRSLLGRDARYLVPGVNTDALASLTRHASASGLGLYDLFTGGNLGRGTVFALGIMPYVTALFIAWLATALGFARGWGARGRRGLAWSVRGVALVLSGVQASAIVLWLERQAAIADGLPLVAQPGWGFRLSLVLTLTTITACLIWLSDEISRRGIGWGVSLLFFAGLVGRCAGCRVGHPGTDAGRIRRIHRSLRARGTRRGPPLALGARRARRSGPVVVPAWEPGQNRDRLRLVS